MSELELMTIDCREVVVEDHDATALEPVGRRRPCSSASQASSYSPATSGPGDDFTGAWHAGASAVRRSGD